MARAHRMNQTSGEEEGAEDGFVLAGEPNGEVDIEVAAPVFGVAGGQVSWTDATRNPGWT